MHNLDPIDIHSALSLVAVKTNATSFLRKECMVTPHANILSCNMLGAALAHDDGSCFDKLLVAALEPQAFSVTVTTVLGGALSFFMCHN